LFRLLCALTVVIAIACVVITHLPSWAFTVLGSIWVAILIAVGYDAWREDRRVRAARLERQGLQT
jgi:hypothetical protein